MRKLAEIEKMKKMMKAVSLLLLFAIFAGAFTHLTGCTKRVEYTIEAGEGLPDASKLIEGEYVSYVAGFDESVIKKPGKYTIPMIADGKSCELILTVEDTTAPVALPKHVYYAIGTGEILPKDFIASVVEADTYEVRFVGDIPSLESIGDYDVKFEVVDASGNVSDVYSSLLTVIYDTEPPVFEAVPELSAYIGEAIAYRRGLVVTDNCGGNIQIEVDSSGVDPSRVGDYSVRFVAMDASGNTSHASTILHIYDEQVTEAMLNSKLDTVIATIISADMNAEQKCRAVYKYIQEKISYVSDSDKSDAVRAAYDSLFVTGTGDCFNYHAAAIYFMKRLGIDYREIQRKEGAGEGTHYWCIVNIGTEEAPRWYHFDTTRLRADYDHSGCLLTDVQVNAYNKVRAGFYEFDSAGYPARSREIITPTPELEPYY